MQLRSALLEELRHLSRTYPDDAGVRKQLAMALYNTVVDAFEKKQQEQRDGLVQELRDLLRTHPYDTTVRGLLSRLSHMEIAQGRGQHHQIAWINHGAKDWLFWRNAGRFSGFHDRIQPTSDTTKCFSLQPDFIVGVRHR